MLIFIFLMTCVVVLADFMGVVNLKVHIPKKYLGNEWVQLYIRKSRFLRKNVDEQVLDMTVDARARLEEKIKEYQARTEAIEKDSDERTRLLAEAKELNAEAARRLKDVEAREQQFQKRFEESQDRETRIAAMVVMYSKMEPDKAGAILSGMENKLVISILQGMAEKKAAKILEFMDSKRATEILKDMAK
jgi:flagellar motility protein MotE (MotC chaperone)